MGKEEGSEAGGGEPNKTNIMETNLKLSTCLIQDKEYHVNQQTFFVLSELFLRLLHLG